MKNVEIHIEELVLHGFKPGDRHRIGAEVEKELIRLVSEQGLPEGFVGPVHNSHLNAGSFSLASGGRAETAGGEIARMVLASLKGVGQQESLPNRKKR